MWCCTSFHKLNARRTWSRDSLGTGATFEACPWYLIQKPNLCLSVAFRANGLNMQPVASHPGCPWCRFLLKALGHFVGFYILAIYVSYMLNYIGFTKGHIRSRWRTWCHLLFNCIIETNVCIAVCIFYLFRHWHSAVQSWDKTGH